MLVYLKNKEFFKNISVNIRGTLVRRGYNLLVETHPTTEMSRETLGTGF
jgi:hypothetical protein